MNLEYSLLSQIPFLAFWMIIILALREYYLTLNPLQGFILDGGGRPGYVFPPKGPAPSPYHLKASLFFPYEVPNENH